MALLGCLRSLCGRNASAGERLKMVYPIHDGSDPESGKLKHLVEWAKYDEERFLELRVVLHQKIIHHINKRRINKVKVDLKVYDEIIGSQSGFELNFANDLVQIAGKLSKQKKKELLDLAPTPFITLSKRTKPSVFSKISKRLLADALNLRPEVGLPLLIVLFNRSQWSLHSRREAMLFVTPLLTVPSVSVDEIIEIINLIVEQSQAFELLELFTAFLIFPKDKLSGAALILLNSSSGVAQEWIMAGFISLALFQSYTDTILLTLCGLLDQVEWKMSPSSLIFAELTQFFLVTERSEEQVRKAAQISKAISNLIKDKQTLTSIRRSLKMIAPEESAKQIAPLLSALGEDPSI